ncbi:PAS domain-containing protein [Pseudooceanicola sp. MF1-13]|uniref:PAS domain-containing protein n=1 Tax=Pseudooceanicola sp. MF1-13 TaxID=3379095 RepID=UPI0038927B41
MTQFASSSRFQPLREVEAYWQAIRAGRLVPRRSDIDPRGIERALEFAFVAERIAPGLGRLRIAGSHLTELLGMEVRGMPLTAFFATDSRNRISDTLEEVFNAPATAEISLVGERGIGKPPLEARMILLPLKSDLGDISRVLGCVVTKGDIGRAPRRFEISEVKINRLLGDAFLPDEVKETPVATGMAEAADPFEAAPRPYLRLVHSDDSN